MNKIIDYSSQLKDKIAKGMHPRDYLPRRARHLTRQEINPSIHWIYDYSNQDWMIYEDPLAWKIDVLCNFIGKKFKQDTFLIDTFKSFTKSRWSEHIELPSSLRFSDDLSNQEKKLVPNHYVAAMGFLRELASRHYVRIIEQGGKPHQVILNKPTLRSLIEELPPRRWVNSMFPVTQSPVIHRPHAPKLTPALSPPATSEATGHQSIHCPEFAFNLATDINPLPLPVLLESTPIFLYKNHKSTLYIDCNLI